MHGPGGNRRSAEREIDEERDSLAGLATIDELTGQRLDELINASY
jgi:hypothetical protein